MTLKVSTKGNMTVLGSDQIRIEEGPALKTATATAELLHDDNTAEHYHAGVRPMTFNDALGKPYEVPSLGRDALGKPIKIGQKMTYLDHGGKKAMGSRCFYVYKRREIDPTNPATPDGDENPHYVPEDVRGGSLLEQNDSPPNRTYYTYIFDEIGTVPIDGVTDEARAEALAKAIALGQDAVKEKADA